MIILKTREKYGDNKYDPIEEKVFLRPISKRIAKALLKTSVTPNMVSVFGFFILLFACGILLSSSSYNHYIAAVILYIALVFDKVDGDLARMRGTAGTKGQYIDGFLDLVAEVLLTLSLAHAAGIESVVLVGLSVAGPLVFNYHGIAAPFYLNIPPSAHKNAESKELKTYLKELAFYGRAKHFFLVILSLLFSAPSVPLFIFPLLIPYTFVLFIKNSLVKKLIR